MSLELEFGGVTFRQRDAADFNRHLDKVRSIMLSGGWFTLTYLAEEVGCSEAGVSARLRDLRKIKHGSYKVEKRIRPGTKRLYEYKIGI